MGFGQIVEHVERADPAHVTDFGIFLRDGLPALDSDPGRLTYGYLLYPRADHEEALRSAIALFEPKHLYTPGLVQATTNVSIDALRTNAYSTGGKLLASQNPAGPATLADGQTVYTGYEFETSAAVTLVKIVASCRPASWPVAKSQSAGGEWVLRDASALSVDIRGQFTNKLKTSSFGNVTYVMRNGAGSIIGGGFANALGTVPKGTDVAWDSWSRLFSDYPGGTFTGVRVQSSVSPA